MIFSGSSSSSSSVPHRVYSIAARAAAFGVVTLAAAAAAQAQNPVATYLFGGTLSAQEGGKPALTATDPLGLNAFTTDTVFGATHTVYQTVGNATPVLNQAGLTLDTTSLLSLNSYSVEMVFKFSDRDGAWRRIIDVQNRQSDNGFYVDTSNQLDIYPVTGGATFTNGVYHDVFLTVASDNTVSAYLDGALAFTGLTTNMDIANPGNLMNFYLDNTAGGGQGEYSNASTALIRLYDGPVSAGQIRTIAANPFAAASTAAPEPGTAALAALFLPLTAVRLARRNRRG